MTAWADPARGGFAGGVEAAERATEEKVTKGGCCGSSAAVETACCGEPAARGGCCGEPAVDAGSTCCG